MSSILTDLSAQQRTQLQEVADLLLQIYETLAELRYVDPESIVRGPHELVHLQETYDRHGLDPSIRHLYTLLPYIDPTQTEARDFFHGGAFFNPTESGDIEQGRDPFYASPQGEDYEAENGPYMRPWFTPLSNMGNHQSVIVYDARLHRIWIVDQEGWGTTDPGLRAEYRKHIGDESEKSDWGNDSSECGYVDDEEGSDDDDSSSHGSSEFWSDDEEEDEEGVNELEQLRQEETEGVDFDEGFEILNDEESREAKEADVSQNTNSFEHIDSRHAGDVLRDINRYYRELKIMPAQGEYNGGEWRLPKEVLVSLYLKHGWPTIFNGEAFEIDQHRAYAAERAKYDAEDPLRQVECYEGWTKYCAQDVERHQQELADAKDVDEEWLARFNLWVVEQRKLRNLEDLKERREKADHLCPGGVCQKEGDLPLWEREWLRVQRPRIDPERRQGESEDAFLARQRLDRNKATIHAKALEAAQADAARLCPGRTFAEATGRKRLGGPGIRERIETETFWVEFSGKEVEKVEKWEEQLPEGAVRAKETVREEIEKNQKALERVVKDVERMERWVEEHGDEE
ncbi:hypothetical protein CLAFUW4_07351 [Fulvia fulva]|uniref:Uncharacterized protein n=1 Tax=Passalora fulva TaxID=5499 RepID=A0A9Q8UQM8_PASFU|nr:uncharacterized protein CLAFUR5_07480 [Fulvia fulva]KAK4622308.1 hypothetical protein CLAFUR4_07358 [Fulvia fulva]KAK4622429.1 hypothetical protein CLAFUR0_07355 [Fulvia fulva]UJO18924.1 hypothetical protein CLAFUR5_07480 [Fulvia fulva]WPV16524.1 hypothetical protein CLAFUW4_07351 [Fulvia fulva]WPV30952.1 hypothetical protein CLAFUW7_07352 [Fulvia fulva]